MRALSRWVVRGGVALVDAIGRLADAANRQPDVDLRVHTRPGLGSWASDRYQQGPGQVHRLWILDVGGDRLVVDAMFMPSTDAKDREELWQVMESIRFET